MKALIIPLVIMLPSAIYAQGNIYEVIDGDSVMRPQFVEELCRSARERTDETLYYTELEKLIARAAGTEPGLPDQKEKVDSWWRKYGVSSTCGSSGSFPEGNFLRQAFHSDYRLFVNIIGPNGRMELDTRIPDPRDGLLPLDYIEKVRSEIEESYGNDRRKFQEDETHRSFTFFYMLLSEFRIR